MVSRLERPTFEDPALQRQIMQLRQVDNVTNLGLSGDRVSQSGGRDRQRGRFRGVPPVMGPGVGLERPGIRDGDHLDRRHPAPAGGPGS